MTTMEKQPDKTIEVVLEYYLTLLGEQYKLQNKLERVNIEIKETQQELCRRLKFNDSIGKFVKVGDRSFCCMKGSDKEPIIIELE